MLTMPLGLTLPGNWNSRNLHELSALLTRHIRCDCPYLPKLHALLADGSSGFESLRRWHIPRYCFRKLYRLPSGSPLLYSNCGISRNCWVLLAIR
jgi:hypothetical protein